MKSLSRPDYRAVIQALRTARQSAGMTQGELAERISRPQSFIAKVESCERRLDIVEFMDACRALGLSAWRLMRDLEEEKPNS